MTWGCRRDGRYHILYYMSPKATCDYDYGYRPLPAVRHVLRVSVRLDVRYHSEPAAKTAARSLRQGQCETSSHGLCHLTKRTTTHVYIGTNPGEQSRTETARMKIPWQMHSNLSGVYASLDTGFDWR
jgi:hypothetical protein